MAFIRPYKETDFDACAYICQATLPPSLSSNPVVVKLAPYIWTHQYTFFSPNTCHILDDGTGRAVGYCIGCSDVHAFAKFYPSYVSKILSPVVKPPPQLTELEPWTILDNSGVPGTTKVNPVALAQTAYNVDWLLFDGNEFLTSRWRATMHIDLLDEWQGKRWGKKLIETFVQSIRESGADYGQGVHIGIAGENSQVVKFYEKVGFRVERSDRSKSDTIHMVLDITG